MNLLLTLLTVFVGNGTGLVGLLIEVAIVAVILWAIWALLQWAGVVVPQPVRIILIALACIVLIILFAKILVPLIQ